MNSKVMDRQLRIHHHVMTPFKERWTRIYRRKDGRAKSDCNNRDFYFHEICSNIPKTFKAELFLMTNIIPRCCACGQKIRDMINSYGCQMCGLNLHLECVKYPPQEVINVPQNHGHKLKLEMVQSCFTCTTCQKDGDGYSYKCHECNLTFHVNCGKYEAEVEVPIHEHSMRPLRDGRMGDCCGIKFEAISDGYYCTECDYFSHKACSSPAKEIKYHSHKCNITLVLTSSNNTSRKELKCDFCQEKIMDGIKFYYCRSCCLRFHLDCVKYPPPHVIDVPQNHDHKLNLEMKPRHFTCAACGKDGDGYSYNCYECFIMTFHASCRKYAAEVTHPSHSLHSLKLFNGEPPAHSDGKCRLCGKGIVDEAFYHCSSCNFTLDLRCVLNPPQLYLRDLNIHDHYLTLMPKKISFTCTTCGLTGDRSPYVCLPCDFTSHNDCSGFPWVININRHDHRVSRVSLLGVVDSVCGVCQKKTEWTCGGYSCQRCPKSVFHTKCATRKDVSDGEEMKGKPEEDEPIEPFEVIDEDVIQHFCHTKHNLVLDTHGYSVEGKICSGCASPIYDPPFYECMLCNFQLHDSCANLPTRKRHMVSNKPYILSQIRYNCSKCEACGVCFNGFKYYSGKHVLDAQCASVSEPFVHKSHPHPLFYTSPRGVCSACNEDASHVLRCVEDSCEYVLDFKCVRLPYVVKHRVDDHFLSLRYGEKQSSGKYWCDICEKETDPSKWFYTCADCGTALHIDCVLGDFRGLEPERDVTELLIEDIRSMTVRNNSMSRPLCNQCKCRCISPVILKVIADNYFDEIPSVYYYCSMKCFDKKYLGTHRYTLSAFLL
ncbi:PREDICTED: uncharacterized protein LOC104789829 [Camelina sativa]|uniref:Uncharacterized protein LOC104789829 n=1 Tax=Camelina sativa TaxID=90675 RepID=A0ABM0ZCE9_CAMSA|nr:PREDICTED: uncharacterized protein LOC104789829 [Camelina sativa]